MVSHRFVTKVRNSPVGITGLAEKAGTTRFWLSQLLSYLDAVEARDPRILRVAKLVGMREEDVFGSGGRR